MWKVGCYLTWVAVGPFGEPPHQPVLGGQDVVPVLLKVGVLEHVQKLKWGKGEVWGGYKHNLNEVSPTRDVRKEA